MKKVVTSKGMEWTVVSLYERETTHGGRLFVASRSHSIMPWSLYEKDPADRSKFIGRFPSTVPSDRLTNIVKIIVSSGQVLPATADDGAIDPPF